MEITHAVIEDHEVDNTIKSMEMSYFSANHDMKRKLRALLWDKRQIFIDLG